MKRTAVNRLACMAGALLLLAGCASTGDKLEASIGQPADRLVRALGQPDARYTLENGDRVLQWNSWSVRKEPRYAYSMPRQTYRSGREAHAADVGIQPLGQAMDVDHFAVEACVAWALVGDDGTIKQGKAHGHGC